MSTRAKCLLGGLMFIQMIFLASTFRTWFAVCLISLVVGLVLLLRHHRQNSPHLHDQDNSTRSFPRWVGWLGWSVGVLAILAITATWRLASQVGTLINPIYVATDVLAHASLFCSLFAWIQRPNEGHVSMLPLGLAVLLLSVAAGGTSPSVAAQTTIALAACLGFTLASQILLGTKRGTNGAIFPAVGTSSGSPNWMGATLSMLTLSILMMATSAVASTTNFILPTIQQGLHTHLKTSLEAISRQALIGGTGFVQGSRLGDIRTHLLSDPHEVVLKVRSRVTPGYLRGNVFSIYRFRKWIDAGSTGSDRFEHIASLQDRSVTSSGAGTTALKFPGRKRLMRFPLEQSSQEFVIPLEIRNNETKGLVFFLPLNTRWIEAKSGGLTLSSDHTVRNGIDTRTPYVAGVGLSTSSEALDPQRRLVMLDVPRYSAVETERVAQEVCSKFLNAKAKAQALTDHFQDQFTYSLHPPQPPHGTDPLANFLRTKHPAHCEYFASATALILRSAGVPTRYVTGYVVDESDEEGDEEDVWLARNRSAHAWVEAYDDDSQVWFPVETTPGRTYRTVARDQERQESASLFDVFNLRDDDDDKSMISMAIDWLSTIRVTGPLLTLFRIAQLPLFCLLLFLLWTKYLKPNQDEVDAIDVLSQKMLRKADRQLKRHALVRRPSETIFQFADRIERNEPDQCDQTLTQTSLHQWATWYRQYATARYQGQLPTPLA